VKNHVRIIESEDYEQPFERIIDSYEQPVETIKQLLDLANTCWTHWVSAAAR